MNITAFTKEGTTLRSHEEVQNTVSEPVKVERIDGSGAKVAENLPSGRVVIYDIEEYDDVERIEYRPDGYLEIEEGVWVETFERIVHIDKVARIETYAVAVEEPVVKDPIEVSPIESGFLR